MAEQKFGSVDEYIASFPVEIRQVLEEVRRTIHAVVPGAGEKISYQIPTITLDGKSLLYFTRSRPSMTPSRRRSSHTAPAKAPSSSP